MLHIYYAKIRENYHIDIEIFPDIIKDYLLRKKNQKALYSSIFSWYCLDLIVKKHYHKNLKDLDFYFTKLGKPMVRLFYFNISHSADFCVVAISNKKIGIDVIVTDHHEPGDEIPKALAVVDNKRKDNKYPFRELAGVGVAFKVSQALAQSMNIREEEYLKYLDIVCVGTISDIVPLVSES